MLAGALVAAVIVLVFAAALARRQANADLGELSPTYQPTTETPLDETARSFVAAFEARGYARAGTWRVDLGDATAGRTGHSLIAGFTSPDRTIDAFVVEQRFVYEKGRNRSAWSTRFASLRTDGRDGRSAITSNYEQPEWLSSDALVSTERHPLSESMDELERRHRAHVAAAGLDAVAVEPDEFVTRMSVRHCEAIWRLEAVGLVRLEQGRIKGTSLLGLRTVLALLVPAWREKRPWRTRAVLVALALGGAFLALEVDAASSDRLVVDGGVSALFAALGVATVLLCGDAALLSWPWTCAPAAVALVARGHGVASLVPWIVALGATLATALRIQRRRYARERAVLAGGKDAAKAPPES